MKLTFHYCIFLMFFIALSCASCKKKVEKEQTSNNPNSEIKESDKFEILKLECEETVCFITVDSVLAQNLIPPENKLYTNEQGGEILFIVQNCNSAKIENKQYAPLKMSHIWIRLEGPYIITPVEGVVESKPTFYWWEYTGFTTNQSLSKKVQQFGKTQNMVESIEFDLKDKGKIIEIAGKENDSYIEWQTEAAKASTPLGINHIVYGKNGGTSMKLLDAGIIRPLSWMGKTSFTIGKGSALSVFGSTLTGNSLDFNMSFKAKFQQNTPK